MKLHVVGGVITLLLGLTTAARAGDKEAAKLNGTWLIVGVEQGGQKIPEKYFEAIPHSITLKDGKYIVVELGKVLEVGTFKVDESKNPASIDLNIAIGDDKGKVQLGIFKLENDRLTMVLAKAGSKTRPTEFATKEGDDHQLSVQAKTKEPDLIAASPPTGFRFKRFGPAGAIFLIPDGWHFHQGSKGATHFIYITPTPFDPKKPFDAGLTVNVVRGNKSQPAEKFAKAFISALGTQNKVIKQWDGKHGNFTLFGVEIEGKKSGQMMVYVGAGNPTTNTILVMWFESPPERWEEAWKIGEVLTKNFALAD